VVLELPEHLRNLDWEVYAVVGTFAGPEVLRWRWNQREWGM
jgi:hypothetical protein